MFFFLKATLFCVTKNIPKLHIFSRISGRENVNNPHTGTIFFYRNRIKLPLDICKRENTEQNSLPGLKPKEASVYIFMSSPKSTLTCMSIKLRISSFFSKLEKQSSWSEGLSMRKKHFQNERENWKKHKQILIHLQFFSFPL